MQSLTDALRLSRNNPSSIISFCQRSYDYISVGYVPALDKIQIACFDDDGRCQMCIWYQIDSKGNWYYEVVDGFKYQRTEEELWEN